jgi:hypothetical protein
MSEAQLDFLLQEVLWYRRPTPSWDQLCLQNVFILPLYSLHLFGANSVHYVKFCRLFRGCLFYGNSQTCCSKYTHEFDTSLKMFLYARLYTQKTVSNFASTTN